MILQALAQHYEALRKKGKVPPYGFSFAKTIALITISPEGELLQITPLTEEVTTGRTARQIAQTRMVPTPYVKSSGITPNFLYDASDYLFGLRPGGKADRTAECHAASANRHREVLSECEGIVAKAILNYFDRWTPNPEHAQIKDNMDLITAGSMIFEVSGHGLAHEDEEVRQAWSSYLEKTASDTELVCLVSGRRAPVTRLHGKIKGIIGGQSSGTVLVGFNTPASESYERTQGMIAPVSEYSANAYVTALNYLLNDRKHITQIGDATVVYWSEGDDEIAQETLRIGLMMSNRREDDDRLHSTMRSIAQALPLEGIDLRRPCHIIGLSPNGGRISVRFHLRNSLGGFLNNIHAHYQRLEIVHAPYERAYLSPWELLRETINPFSQDKQASPLLAGAFLRSILQNTRYPATLYQATLLRLHAQQDDPDRNVYKVTRGRAAIIKACLLMDGTLTDNEKEALTPMLNEDSTNKAYVLGRLFSVLEDAQQTANPGINATIKDRYFSSACMTPRVAFPRLLQLNQHHLNKISNEGAVVNIIKRLGALMNKLNVDEQPFPAHLSLQEQGLFILGYYQQTQSRYTAKKEDK